MNQSMILLLVFLSASFSQPAPTSLLCSAAVDGGGVNRAANLSMGAGLVPCRDQFVLQCKHEDCQYIFLFLCGAEWQLVLHQRHKETK